jgi:hypothetical protein
MAQVCSGMQVRVALSLFPKNSVTTCDDLTVSSYGRHSKQYYAETLLPRGRDMGNLELFQGRHQGSTRDERVMPLCTRVTLENRITS